MRKSLLSLAVLAAATSAAAMPVSPRRPPEPGDDIPRRRDQLLTRHTPNPKKNRTRRQR